MSIRTRASRSAKLALIGLFLAGRPAGVSPRLIHAFTSTAAPPVFERKGRVPSASGLAFPGKVLAEPSGKFVFISDSNHDRVIIADLLGVPSLNLFRIDQSFGALNIIDYFDDGIATVRLLNG